MSIPQEILAVKRPTNTRVKQSGNHFYVVKRTCVRKNGKNIPKELGTIGEIINGVYIEKRKEPRDNHCDIKDYGEFALCDLVSKDLLQELANYFELQDAKRIYVIALLRACYGDVRNRNIATQYKTSYISEVYPGISLEEHTISTFLQNLGSQYASIRDFMKEKVKAYTGNTLIIDGTLRDNNSYTNMFSEMSRKGAKKGSKDLSLLYVYDPEKGEPLAAKPYPGNMLDMTSTNDFITEFDIKKGMLIMDKGCFSPKMITQIEKNTDLAYIMPLKRNNKKIKEYDMLNEIADVIQCKDSHIMYKKKKINDNHFLYSFRDPKGAFEQEVGYLSHSINKDEYSRSNYLDKQKEFGTIVFESNKDIEPKEIYEAYLGRWEIEVMFDFYKNIIELETVRVHGDYRIYATEFINYLTVIISSRIKKKLSETVLLNRKGNSKMISDCYSFKQVFLYLSKYKMVRTPDRKNWKRNALVKYIEDLALSLKIMTI